MASISESTPETTAASAPSGLAALAGGLFRTRAAQFGWFALLALATRISVFGDTNFFHDELFYFQVGQRMHDGLLPYVDLWDRKGPGLFLTYYLIAGISRSVVAFQAAAWLFASLTALIIAMTAQRFAGRVGAILAGTLYIAVLPLFGGGGGQSPVFYNLWMALCGLAVVRAMPHLDRGRVPGWLFAAMASAGFALTFKQTAICESTFFGLFVLWRLHRSGTAPLRLMGIAAGLMAAGATPMAVFGGFYAATGNFAEFWHAMVTSNLTKAYNPGNDALMRITGLTIMFAPAAIPAIAGIAMRGSDIDRGDRLFLGGWLLAGVAGVAVVPNFYEHYMLPLAVPAAVAAARALGMGLLGPAFAAVACFLLLTTGPAFEFSQRQASRIALDQLAANIRARDPDPKLLIYEGPVYLYTLLDRYPPSPIFYPLHLYFPPEAGTAYLDTTSEMHKTIAWRPDVVLTFHENGPDNENQATASVVRDYLKQCRLWFTRDVIEVYGTSTVDVYGDCNSLTESR